MIISRANTIALVGAVVRAEKDYPNRLLSDKTLRLVVKEDEALPDYLLEVLKWPEARAYIENNATGTSDSMRNISQKTIRSIPVPLIRKDEQIAIVDKAKEVSTEIKRAHGAAALMLQELKRPPQKILSEAFGSEPSVAKGA